jgi:hypothetical protein
MDGAAVDVPPTGVVVVTVPSIEHVPPHPTIPGFTRQSVYEELSPFTVLSEQIDQAALKFCE